MSETPYYAWTDTLKYVYYGPGSVKSALPKLLDALKASRALVVTGKTLHEKTDVVRKIEAILKESNAYGATFYEIGQHAPIAGIKNGVKAFRENNCDVIVSVGGGSPIDASKAILYMLQKETGGPTLFQIAIPTTLSAAEYTVGAGYTDEQGNKASVNSQELAPAGIILDAELTLATPQRLWLSTGIRAVDHAVENLYKPLMAEPLKALCYAALSDLFKYLPISKANPQDVEVRQKLQLAAWMSLWPAKRDKYTSLGLSHSLGHKLGARYGIPHGVTSCLTLAPVVDLKADVASQEDKEHLAQVLFYLRTSSTGTVEGDVHKLAALIDGLVKDLGLKSTLSEHAVPRTDIPDIASRALGPTDDALLERVVKLLENIY
ncbi:alcohol dehydrogenase IV [Amanita rubescens]|nr:alcohol dehydrogenase IV [Amanita rubescens]